MHREDQPAVGYTVECALCGNVARCHRDLTIHFQKAHRTAGKMCVCFHFKRFKIKLYTLGTTFSNNEWTQKSVLNTG